MEMQCSPNKNSTFPHLFSCINIEKGINNQAELDIMSYPKATEISTRLFMDTGVQLMWD